MTTEAYALIEGVESEGGMLWLSDGTSVPDTLSMRREFKRRFAAGYPLTGWAAGDYTVDPAEPAVEDEG